MVTQPGHSTGRKRTHKRTAQRTTCQQSTMSRSRRGRGRAAGGRQQHGRGAGSQKMLFRSVSQFLKGQANHHSSSILSRPRSHAGKGIDKWMQDLEWTNRLMDDLQLECDGVPAPKMPFEDQEVSMPHSPLHCNEKICNTGAPGDETAHYLKKAGTAPQRSGVAIVLFCTSHKSFLHRHWCGNKI